MKVVFFSKINIDIKIFVKFIRYYQSYKKCSLFVNKLFRGKIDKVIFYGKRFF